MQDILTRIGVNVNVSFYIIFYTLIWMRILMMASVVPFLFGKPVPRYVVVAASFLLAAFAFPHLIPDKPPPILEDRVALVMLYVKEIFYGLSIGMVVSVVFHAFACVGQMVDNQRGVSIARVLIPQLGESAAISALFLYQFGVALYLSMGGHIGFLDSFFMGFKELPVLAYPTAGPGLFAFADFFMKVTGEVIYISLQMSTPVIIAIFLADLILGVANRVAPQINVWMLGFQLKGYLGTLILFISLTMVADQMQYYGTKTNQYAKESIEMFQGKIPPDAPKEPTLEDGKILPEGGPLPVKTR